MDTRIRTYSELMEIDDFLGRFRYLAVRAEIGVATFGFDRWINQEFYSSRQWRTVRRHVQLRDDNCDLGHEDHYIHDRVYIHHMNPMDINDIVLGEDHILEPEFLITTCHRTHNAIHYGDERLLPRPHVERRPGDTTLWGKVRQDEDTRSRGTDRARAELQHAGDVPAGDEDVVGRALRRGRRPRRDA